ncbi:MAG: PLP-dependent aminotransferase family protein, partial [Clostridiales bacterium]|nr:PLP-dependent aminotransferase family protein [Clostridiales bacterium]
PTPSLHALSGGKNVIYLGSFSKILLPSIRISFMVLTEDLAKKYKENIFKYSQTASKTEQLALCSFIRDGHLKSQIKKTRRFYTLKAKNFANTLGCFFPRAEIEISENALLVIMKIPFDKDYDIFERSGISVNIEKNEADKISIIFNPSGISENDFEKCAEFISKIINKD